MRNSYLQPKRSPTTLLFVAVGIATVLLFGVDTLTDGIVRSYSRTLSAVVWSGVSRAGSSLDHTGYFATRRKLVEENERLQSTIALYEEQSARYRALEVQNESLRDMVSLVESERDGVTVRVLSSFRASPYGTFVIGAGERDGIAQGDIVLTPGGFALGRVSSLDAHTATVDALFSPGNSVEVIVGNVAFPVEGRGGGNARAEIPRGAEIAVGDAAIAPSFGGRVTGVIGSIESASSSATQTVFLRLPHSLDSLRFVYVVPGE